MVIDHIGIVVKSLEKGVKLWENIFGYKKMTDIVTNSRQKVKVVFLEKKNSSIIKLIEPVDSSSPVFKYAMRGGGLHHLCFRCGNVIEKTKELQEKGLRVLTAPQPGEAFGGEKISFLYANQGLNIELIDTLNKNLFIAECKINRGDNS